MYSKGQQVVFSYPMVSPKVPASLMTPYSYLMGHHSHSFLSQNGRKRLKTSLCWYLPSNPLFHTQICFEGQQVVFNYPMVSPRVPTTLMTLYSYPMGHHIHSFVNQNGQKQLKTGFWSYLPPQPPILHTSMFYGPTRGVQLSYGITWAAYYTHYPIYLPYGPP